MSTPEKKPPLLLHTKGLDSNNSTLIFERYTQSQAGGANAIKVFENGDCYKIFKGRKVGLDSDLVVWNKKTTLDEKSIKKVKNIIADQATEFVKSPNQKKIDKPISFSFWYFYGDNEMFAYTQDQRFRFEPKFVRKLMKTLDL